MRWSARNGCGGSRGAYGGRKAAGVTVATDTRLALGDDLILWRVAVTNERAEAATVTVSQDLFAPVAHSETGWGWLYSVPWNGGDYHDYHSLERVRATTRPGHEDDPYLLWEGARRVRLGRPRPPGIQRDEDAVAMLLESALPRHVSQDVVYPHGEAAHGTVRALRVGPLRHDGEVELDRDTRVDLDAVEVQDGTELGFDFRPATLGHAGVILTHGNHPDSLQCGLDGDRLWVAICGEREYAARPVTAGTWHRIEISVDQHQAVLRLDGREAARTRHWTASPRWVSKVEGDVVGIVDRGSAARAFYAFDGVPSTVERRGFGGRATWTLELAPGETRTFGVACAYGTDPAAVAAAARRAAAGFAEAHEAVERGWRQLWSNMFKPDNDDFSGHLPTLHTGDRELARAYYMGALLVLYMRNLTASRAEPTFLTGGPRLGPTTTFYWDHTEWSRMYALLEPAGLRAWLLRGLAQPYDEAFGFDVRGGGPLGNNYASNHYSLFRLVEHYVGVTGDLAFLDELAGSVTVGAHLERLAYGWRDRQTRGTGGVLADFGGDPWVLLECVPNYTNAVASFNAAYAGMLRSYAALLRHLGDATKAERVMSDAAALAAAVGGLYAGGGRWKVRHPDRSETIGHVLDFGLVAAALHADLDERVRGEMVSFVTERLLSGDWMRALAADDPIAPHSDRPDHGAAGAFGAWPGVTAYGLAKLGRRDLALGVLRATPRAASGALWGQAMELVDGGRRARVAERGTANRDSIAGAATAEAVLAGLFGVEPGFESLSEDRAATVDVPDIGSLTGLNLARSGVLGAAPQATLPR
ncbi:hypothetical protein ACFQ1L_30220 [Phytohabitans flavus]|uniref:hypothetical protein n=1 Tax=Phytohabitans flavus TaxID=1076124 RepID=UPI00363950F4